MTEKGKDCRLKNMTVIKEMKDKNKLENILCSWIRRINLVKMSIPPEAHYKHNAIPIKLAMTISIEIEKQS